MAASGLSPKPASSGKDMPQKRPSVIQDGTSEEAKQLAAAALSAVKDAAAASAAASRGKVEVSTFISTSFYFIFVSITICLTGNWQSI